MVKVCEKDFPKGSLEGQQSDGFYMDGYIQANLDIMAKRIVDDMQFVGIISGKGTVRNGKSTFAQHQGYYFTHKVNELHKLKNTFTMENIVFKADDLIDKAFSLPKYSVLILDEGDDLTAQYYSKLAIKLRRFFRKCGQLNLFFLLLIPDFFELPRAYAVTRSTYLVNVLFMGEFERGFFEFYSGEKKRELYYKGRRYGDYHCVKENFKGRFPKPYLVDEKEYRARKLSDMMTDEGEESTPIIREAENIRKLKMIQKINEEHKLSLTQKEYAYYVEVAERTIRNYLRKIPREIAISA